MDDIHHSKVPELEARIEQLNQALSRAKNEVQSWVEENSALSCSAAEARAKNQGAGRGIVSAFFGPKFRAALRAGAAASNAAIAKDVAEKRSHIAERKRQAQEMVKEIQRQLALCKSELKQFTSKSKASYSAKASGAKAASTAIDIMHKLKQAHDAGLLTDREYESKRRKLLAQL
jgi:regulator of replication initiation timing